MPDTDTNSHADQPASRTAHSSTGSFRPDSCNSAARAAPTAHSADGLGRRSMKGGMSDPAILLSEQ